MKNKKHGVVKRHNRLAHYSDITSLWHNKIMMTFSKQIPTDDWILCKQIPTSLK